MDSMNFVRIAGAFYPIIVTQLMGEISEAKAAELTGLGIERYREAKQKVAETTLAWVLSCPSGFSLLMETMKAQPEPKPVSKDSSL